MKIKIGNKTILCTRKKDHKDFLWERIMELRNEIIQLIRKYSRRLKILDT